MVLSNKVGLVEQLTQNFDTNVDLPKHIRIHFFVI